MTHAEFAAEFTQAKRSFDDMVSIDVGRVECEAACMVSVDVGKVEREASYMVALARMECEAAYMVALARVERIDEDLARDIRHYYNKAGELLTTLDQVVSAILADDLAGPEFTPEPRQDVIPEMLRRFYRRRYRLMKERRAALGAAA